MKHKYPVGTWVRFRTNTKPTVLAIVKQLIKEDPIDGRPIYFTSEGAVAEDEILEARKPGKEVGK